MTLSSMDENVQLCLQCHNELWYTHAQNLIKLCVLEVKLNPKLDGHTRHVST